MVKRFFFQSIQINYLCFLTAIRTGIVCLGSRLVAGSVMYWPKCGRSNAGLIEPTTNTPVIMLDELITILLRLSMLKYVRYLSYKSHCIRDHEGLIALNCDNLMKNMSNIGTFVVIVTFTYIIKGFPFLALSNHCPKTQQSD